MAVYNVPTYVGSTVPASHASANTQTVNYPTGVNGGDLLILALRLPLTATYADPSGWTRLGPTPVDAANSVRLYIWGRVAGGSIGSATTDSGSVTVTTSPLVAVVSPGFMMAIRPDQSAGALTLAQMINDIQVVADNDTTTSDLTVPSFTTTVQNTLAIRGSLVANGNNGTGITGFPGTKRVEDTDGTTATTRTIAAGTITVPLIGTQASINLTDSTGQPNDVSVGFAIAVRSAAIATSNINTLSDDFQDNSVNGSLWTTTAGASETGGRASFALSTSFPKYDSVNFYTLIGSQVIIDIATLPNLGNGGTQFYSVLTTAVGGSTFIGFHWQNGTLYFEENISGSLDRTSITYNYSTMRWLRLREASGTVYWETSPDGINWTTQRSKTPGRSWEDVKLELTAGYSGTEPSPGTFEVEKVNIYPVGSSVRMPYTVNQTAGSSTRQPYTVLTSVGTSDRLPYTVTTSVGASRILPYTVNQLAGASRALPYSVTGATVGSSTRMPYTVNTSIGISRTQPFTVMNLAGTSRIQPYTVKQLAGSSRILPYSIINSVGISRREPYTITNSVGTSRRTPYTIYSLIGASRSLPYNIIILNLPSAHEMRRSQALVDERNSGIVIFIGAPSVIID